MMHLTNIFRDETSWECGSPDKHVLAEIVGLLAAIVLLGSASAHAATSANAKSPLGMNLAEITYSSAEQPFLNIFKTTGISQENPTGWVTSSSSSWDTGEEANLQLDNSGYPTTLTSTVQPQKFTRVCALILRNIGASNEGSGPPYRAGQYIVLYDGQGTITYGFDAALVSSSSGRDVVEVATPTYSGGFLLCITSTDPNKTGNYIRNIRVVKAEEEALLDAGNVFRPSFLSLLRTFKVLRFTAWLDTNGNTLTSWTNRPQLSDAGWGTSEGVPLEVAIQLCNATGADCWLNVPAKADDNYITQMATLVHQELSSTERVYVEFSNEVWNSVFPEYQYAIAQGKSLWPSAVGSDFDYNRNWYGMRNAQMCDMWKSVWSANWGNVVCVLGAQAASTYTATEALNCPFWVGSGNGPCYGHNISAVAIAPYFGNFQAQTSWTSMSDGGLSNLFAQLNTGGLIAGLFPGGDLAQTSSWEAAYAKALQPYNLPFIAYEGGQQFVGAPSYLNGSGIVNLYINANRDPRMGAAYTAALNDWKANGGELYVLFNDIYTPSQYGEWGALENFMDSTLPLGNAPPKWQAIQNFISGDPCWWAGCNGTIADTTIPTAPPYISTTQ